ncbi:odorant receptor 131-2-like [Etheostoma spectabile]|uniref:odorant receptor 131-2-like n=1 Tax=Etheostoma spectabile TaxID=54343 RepID=UPI0013AF8AC3|nr:odorant receptor 131-2-like [Etheostoma spectabile]
MLYIIAMVRMISYVSIIATLFAGLTVKMSPLNLAVMCLKRYVAICFPLRHAVIATTRMASSDSLSQHLLYVNLENPVPRFSHRQTVFQLQMYSTVNMAFTIAYFVLASMIIIYAYNSVIIAASSNVPNASKPHKTVRLHLLEFCLCLTFTLFNIINPSSTPNTNPAMASLTHYVLLLVLIIFPKC